MRKIADPAVRDRAGMGTRGTASASAPAAVDMFFQADGLQGRVPPERVPGRHRRARLELGGIELDLRHRRPPPAPATAKPPGSQPDEVHRSDQPRSSSPASSPARSVPKAELTVVKPGDIRLPYLRLCFTGVRFTCVSTGGSGGEDRLTENVTFATRPWSRLTSTACRRRPRPCAVFSGWDLVNKIQFRRHLLRLGSLEQPDSAS